jgi:3-phenylpropionate/cinnamic acid dioxygenase small subunit
VTSPQEEIRNLLGRYCECMDAGDFDGIGALFADATMVADDGNVLARGREEVAASYTRGTQMYDGRPGTRHITANTIIELDEASGTAEARSVYTVFQATPNLPLQPIIAGRYRDRFAGDGPGTWRFVERVFYVDLVGDLSQHLTYTLDR